MSDDQINIRYLETTGRCNLNCPVCVERYRNFDMRQEEFLAIVDRNRDIMKGNWIWMDFNGEPLLDPLFYDRAKYLKGIGAEVMISTNGMLLSRENTVKLLQTELDYIVISVTTLNPELYHQIRGVDRLPQVLKNVKLLKETADEMNSKTEIQAVAIDTGKENLEQFIDYFHSMGLHAAVHQFTNRAHCSRKVYQTEHHELAQRGACQGRKQNLVILCNCDVVSCCCDFAGINVLGNLRDFDYSMKDLIENSDIDTFFEDQDRQIFRGACAVCDDWIYFQRNAIEQYVTVYPFEGNNYSKRI